MPQEKTAGVGLIQYKIYDLNFVNCDYLRGGQTRGMADGQDDNGALREAIARALLIADERLDHLVGALLAQCLDELDRKGTRDA